MLESKFAGKSFVIFKNNLLLQLNRLNTCYTVYYYVLVVSGGEPKYRNERIDSRLNKEPWVAAKDRHTKETWNSPLGIDSLRLIGPFWSAAVQFGSKISLRSPTRQRWPLKATWNRSFTSISSISYTPVNWTRLPVSNSRNWHRNINWKRSRLLNNLQMLGLDKNPAVEFEGIICKGGGHCFTVAYAVLCMRFKG